MQVNITEVVKVPELFFKDCGKQYCSFLKTNIIFRTKMKDVC